MGCLDNYIFYSICEKAYEIFDSHSYYRTFNTFCTGYKTAMLLNTMNSSDLRKFYSFCDYIQLIYNLTPEEGNMYVIDFFLLEKWVIFEPPVKMMSTHFKNSLN